MSRVPNDEANLYTKWQNNPTSQYLDNVDEYNNNDWMMKQNSTVDNRVISR
jgi:hypothetical protein